MLHVARWEAGDLSDPMAVIEAINQLGYGLTMGIQTRIDSRAAQLARAACMLIATQLEQWLVCSLLVEKA